MATSSVKNFISDQEFEQMMGGGSPAPVSTPAPIPATPQQDNGFSVREMGRNVLPSAGRLVGDLASAVFNPIDTLKGLGGIAAGGVSKVLPGRQKTEDNFDAVISMYRDRYGGWDKFLETLEKDPVGTLSDASVVLGGAGAAIKGAGIATKSAKIASTGARIAEAGKVLDPVLRGTQIAGKVPGVGAIVEQIKILPERLIRSATGQAKAELLAGKDVSKYVIQNKKVGTARTLIADSEKAINNIGSAISNNLRNNATIFNRNSLIQDFANNSKAVINSELKPAEVVGRIIKGYPQAKRLLSKPTLTIAEVDELRQILDRSLGDAAFISTQEGAFTQKLAKDFSNNLRGTVQTNAPDTVPLFDDLENEINLKSALDNKVAQGSRNQVVTFGDLIGGGLGMGIGGPMGGILGVAGRRILQSTPVLTGGAVGIDRIGKVLAAIKPAERANLIRFMRSLVEAQPDQGQGMESAPADFIPDEQFPGSGPNFKIISIPEQAGTPGLPDVGFMPQGKKKNLPQDNNNPLNIKYGGATKKWVEQGLAVIDEGAKDGGKFLSFKDPETGLRAAKDLLVSQVYSGLTVDQAMKKWSNKGYGGEIAPKIKTKRISQLSATEVNALVKRMAQQEGFYA